MPRPAKSSVELRGIAAAVRKRIQNGGDRPWRLDDFLDLPSAAVAQTLSRLSRTGALERLSKGLYYRSLQTLFGKSHPNPKAIQELVSKRKTVLPAGLSAANLLGFTSQISNRREVATDSLSLPRKLLGEGTVIHTRRPESWARLNAADAALLDFLRRRGKTSELSPKETIERTLALMSEGDRFERILKVADSEPPRVRAMLGAIGEQLGKDQAGIKRLRASLNPLSKFQFGMLAGLARARAWQAKEARS